MIEKHGISPAWEDRKEMNKLEDLVGDAGYPSLLVRYDPAVVNGWTVELAPKNRAVVSLVAVHSCLETAVRDALESLLLAREGER